MVIVAYVLVSAAALARLAVIGWPEAAVDLVLLSGVAWTVAFAVFFIIYAPFLMRPRVDGRPG